MTNHDIDLSADGLFIPSAPPVFGPTMPSWARLCLAW